MRLPVKRLYTVKESAVYLARPVSSIRTLIWKGLLPVVKDEGRRMYLDIKDLDTYINKNKETYQ
jgi:excisionase family DNA binding protein